MGNFFNPTLILLFIFLPTSLLADTFTSHCRNYPPELYFDGDKCVGVIPDLVSDMLLELGHHIQWLKAPWIRSYREAKKGKVDILIRHSMTPEREAVLLPITYGYSIRNLSFYTSPNFTGNIGSYQDLAKMNVGAIRGVFYSPKFSSLDPNTLTLVGTTEQLVSMLELGRIDVVATSATQRVELFAQQFEKAAFVDSFTNAFYISVVKLGRAVPIFDDLSEKMLEYRISGKINRYYEKYDAIPPMQEFD
ncbi:transporter substrate-binding domain-containing protein [Paraglaciecola chathamensis]|uniref:Transporter substrate-binding domain-containing protein n=1 Tax=Paraglaciecola chathamensis TaxID=368405 RepID=A0ABS0WC82_9ALTE|nr:transporter substrate-binding domain-containing protein [Paraglaciecola chathamensis]MBJ2136089.1 transporter substrate-binding domain-containing protein [Paraglaciecola chathamensis]